MDEPVRLREVSDGDLPRFFDHHRDTEANRMAAFTSEDPSDEAAFRAHWGRIRANPTVTVRSILVGDSLAGHVASFDRDGDREVTYWIGREFWGRGVATEALRAFLDVDRQRPIHGRVAADNHASIRVLRKCGFCIVGEDRGFANARGAEIREFILRLEAGDASPGGLPPGNPEGAGSDFSNVYDDERRARSYDRLEFPGTYYLAYRDLPDLLSEHVRGTRALDFGCGTGRSTRFLKGLGFDVVGVDVSEPMLALARERDPGGRYERVPDGDLGALPAGAFDLALSVFTFDNIPTAERKEQLLRGLRRLLDRDGRIVSVVSAPEIYVNEWASFTTKEFPENRRARSGDRVRIVMLDVEDARPVEDVLCTEEAYLDIYRRAGLRAVRIHRPLGSDEEPFPWVSETSTAAWTIYVLAADTEGR